MIIDFGCIATQFAGAIIPASGDSSAIALAQKIIFGGLVAQLIALLAFFVMTRRQHQTLRGGERHDAEHPKTGSRRKYTGNISAVQVSNVTMNIVDISWKKHFRALEAATVLLAIRSLVRLVEYAQGFSGFVASHEVFIYLFDALPMCTITILFVALHPQGLMRKAKQYEEKQDRMALVALDA